MKKILGYSLLAAVVLMACKEKTQLEALISRRDSLRTEAQTVKEQLAEVESQIEKMDTTTRLTRVTAIEVKPASFNHFFEVYGSVEAPENVLLSAQTSGELLTIPVREGQKVDKGALLVTIDSEVIRANIAEVESQLNLANDIFKRQERLWEKKIGSELQYLEAKNQKESLEKRLETLRAQLKMTQIKAPFSGTIDEIFPNVGEMAAPGTPLIRLVSLNKVYINADVSERQLNAVEEGTPVTVMFDALDITIDTVISRTGDFINPNNRTFSIRVDIENPTGKIKPNLMARLRIRDYHVDSALVVPSNLVQQTPSGENFVYTVSQSTGEATVKKVSVRIGKSNQQAQTIILEGLKPGDYLVEKGSRSIKEGQKVAIANS